MTKENSAPGSAPTPSAPRFDAKFIEEHRLVERYLEDKLPMKGARELENWCRVNSHYLIGLRLSERTQASLKLLEASGRLMDLREPAPQWWKSAYVPITLAALTLVSLAACWALFGKYALVRSQLEVAHTRIVQGSLEPAAAETQLRVTPDRAPDIERARITVSRGSPQLMDLHIDLNYTKALQFRMIVDKKDQGRALILNNLLKDSNGELRLTFNSSGLAAGIYNVRIEALPEHGTPIPQAWMILEVQ